MSSSSSWIQRNNVYNDYYENKYTDFAVLYNSEVNKVANFILSPPFEAIFVNLSDYVKGLTYYPLSLISAVTPPVDAYPTLSIGGEEVDDVPYRKPNLSYTLFFLGSKYIAPHFNDFADYNGYTKIELHLPYFGSVELSPNDVMGKSVGVNLKVDLLTGQGVYYVCVREGVHDSDDIEYPNTTLFNGRILSTYVCQLGINIPISSTNASDIQRNLVLGAVRLGGSIIGGALSNSATTSAVTSSSRTIQGVNKKRIGGRLQTNKKNTFTEDIEGSRTYANNYGSVNAFNKSFDTSVDALSNMVLRTQSDKVNNPSLLSNGNMSLKLVIYRPKINVATSEYNHLYGRPLGEVRYLSSLKGYTEIPTIHFEDAGFATITSEERSLIEQIFAGGVIL